MCDWSVTPDEGCEAGLAVLLQMRAVRLACATGVLLRMRVVRLVCAIGVLLRMRVVRLVCAIGVLLRMSVVRLAWPCPPCSKLRLLQPR